MMKLLSFQPSLLAFGLLMAADGVRAEIPKPTDAPKPRSPEESAAAFKLPDGFRMEIVASEPLISSPSGICWNERGQMFVTELHGYNLEGQLDIEELNKTGQLDTVVRRVQADEKFKRAAEFGTYGVVKVLRDIDGDGRMDRADIWSTNLPPAYGLVPARGGVIVACAPHIMFFADRDGDGKPEVQERLFTGFKTGPLERGINMPQWGADGWIYFGRGAGGGRITGPHLSQPVDLPGTDFRIRADGSAIEPVTGGTGTFGFALTEVDDRFTMSTGEPGRCVAPLPWRYLKRNPDVATPRLEVATGDKRVYPLAPAHPWRLKRAEHAAYAKFYRDRYGAGDSDAGGWFTSACSPLIYRDSALPGLRGQYFVCEPSGNLIHRALIKTDGAMLTLHRAPGEEKSEFAATSDSWSHPMNLTHGPDGSIWVVDYYREIIEDYSAIPRHLQQQYGLYAGHDRGRIYRLTHRDAPRPPSVDMSSLGAKALALECGSPLFWRRQTAQRLLAERVEQNTAPLLREFLADKNAEAHAFITLPRTLEQLGVLTPRDLEPFMGHAEPAVRIHALRLADRWFAQDEGRALLDSTLLASSTEPDPRVQIQIALSLGETRDPRAFATLARFALSTLSVRWMDVALLSSLQGRGVEMLATLIGDPGGAALFLPMLAQSIAARRDEREFAYALNLVASAKPDTQHSVLDALAKGRKNAPRKPLGEKSARDTLASLAASPNANVRKAARALEETFVAVVADDEGLVPAGKLPPPESISNETFQKFTAALAGPRDLKHGHQLFLQACATCHRIGNEGHDVGPDLMGQLGMAEEALLKDLLLPNERIRPGYETTLVQTGDGSSSTGILKDDGATSLTLALPNGVEQVFLRKDVVGVRRLATSLMPSFADGIAPAEVASLLAWLRSHLVSGVALAERPSKLVNSFSGAKVGVESVVGGIKLCWCPPGKFIMGSPRGEPERRPGEDQVEVTLTKGFWMGKYEATQGEWKRVMGRLPGELTPGGGEGDDLPVYNVNYAEAEGFCRKLTELARASGELPSDWEFRLPTEAQWEYACRAGTTTATSFGDTLNSKQANVLGKPYNGAEPGPSLNHAVKVGSYPANAWGLHDMHGNVVEWCRDWYHGKLPGGTDPDLASVKGAKNGDGTYSRCRRGSAWTDDAWASRSAFRQRYEPERRADHIGIRVVVIQL